MTSPLSFTLSTTTKAVEMLHRISALVTIRRQMEVLIYKNSTSTLFTKP